MNKIPVVISSDNKIFFTVGVVLSSLLENAHPNTFYDINVLHTRDVTQENLKALLKLKSQYPNMSLNLFDMGDKFQKIPHSKNYHVNYVSAYKMLIPSLFPQYEKVIYLDTDIIVRGDLTELYNFKMQDNYIASIPVLTNCILKPESLKQILDVPNIDFYINAGVMLMNLTAIRKHHIAEQWIKLLGTFEGSVDQHILNKVCYGKTTYFPLRFNVCLSEINLYKFPEAFAYYSPKEITEALNNPVIFHWSGKPKPWLYKDLFLAQEWLKYYFKSPVKTTLDRKALPHSTHIKKYYLFHKQVFRIEDCPDRKKFYLFKAKVGSFKKGDCKK